ncbi:MAG TPA: SOS response-associated peptidase family protein [Parapedobacter sp.]|uniref:SOS response-associated peptidase n=1 Tax=Parapedobacter sp. TaxID=1958893 RepID=UPI002CB85D32|nr:SOS response-associated peptidase family protein [Parapedobacter sp.]HWK58124.1 SOS response-associated peptidase family protein [Parapedobacter sp.]
MCYHTSHPDERAIRKHFKSLGSEYQGERIYHVSGFVRPTLPAILNNRPDTVVPARWKLIPFWVKDEEGANKYANTLNAESESIFEKASYKNFITKNRGLLIVDGFFEPHKVAGVKDTENYYLHLEHHEPFTLGIVWAEFNGYPTFSVITTKANPQLEEIHNEKKRMPFVVDPVDRDDWLNATDPIEIKQLMRPWDGEFFAHRVRRVTAIRGEDTNVPEIQDPI